MEATTKKCSKCGEVKALSEFYRSDRESLGVRNICKKCSTAYTMKWRSDNPGRNAAAKRERHKKNPEKAREAGRRYYENNKDKEKARHKKYQLENRDAYLETAKASGTKRRSTPQGKLSSNVSRAIRHRLRDGKSGKRTFEILGYTVEDLRSHLESRFEPGMSWENYGEWHIDHIVPLAAHNYETPDDIDFKRAWALSNLQPLWATDNFSKGKRLAKVFQPSLALAFPANDNTPQAIKKDKASES